MPTKVKSNGAADIASGTMEIGDNGPAAPIAASQDMSDEEIAAAFALLQQSARPEPAPSVATQQTEILAFGDRQANGDVAKTTAVTAETFPQESPTFMSPSQRADSLALMVEELQLMYLERTGG